MRTYTILDPADFTGTISNFAPDTTIDLAGIDATSAKLGAGNVLNVLESNGDTLSLNLDDASSSLKYASYMFAVAPDGHGGTDIINPIFSDNFNTHPINSEGGYSGYNWTGGKDWRIASGSVDLCGEGPNGIIAQDYLPGNGCFIDMDGSTQQPGALRTTMKFAPGKYTVNFELAGNQRDSPEQTTDVRLGNSSTTSIPLSTFAPLQQYSETFTTTKSGPLVFSELPENDDGDNDMGNILDDVQVLRDGRAYGLDSGNIQNISSHAAVVAKDYDFVGAYLNPHGGQQLTATTAKSLSAHGAQICSIWETKGMDTASYYEGAGADTAYDKGMKAGEKAYEAASAAGQGINPGSAIYFATDAPPDELTTTLLLDDIADYFKGVAAGFQAEANSDGTQVLFSIGVYGYGGTDAEIKDSLGLAKYSWLANGGKYFNEGYADWNIKQTSNTVSYHVPIDTDVANSSYFGQWEVALKGSASLNANAIV